MRTGFFGSNVAMLGLMAFVGFVLLRKCSWVIKTSDYDYGDMLEEGEPYDAEGFQMDSW